MTIRPFERRLPVEPPATPDSTRYAPPSKPPLPRPPKARKAPKPAAPAPPAVMSPNTAWLNESAEHWAGRSVVLVWDWNTATKRFVGYSVVAAAGGVIAQVKLVE